MSLLLFAAIILAIIGLIGAVMPAVPGAPFSFGSLVCAFLAFPEKIPIQFVIAMLIFTIIVMVLDYIAPIIMTKIGGGSKYAINGATIGMIIAVFGMFFSLPIIPVSGPTLLILGPLVGAFVGEMMYSSDTSKALKVALMNFVSFLLTTIAKIALSCICIYYSFVHLLNA